MSTKLWIGDKMYIVDEEVEEAYRALVKENRELTDEVEILRS